VKIRALCHLVGVLIITTLYTAAFAISVVSTSLDRVVEQAKRERSTSAGENEATTGRDSGRPQIELIYLHRSTTQGFNFSIEIKLTPYVLLKDGTIYNRRDGGDGRRAVIASSCNGMTEVVRAAITTRKSPSTLPKRLAMLLHICADSGGAMAPSNHGLTDSRSAEAETRRRGLT
jgi:hypothetical protein